MYNVIHQVKDAGFWFNSLRWSYWYCQWLPHDELVYQSTWWDTFLPVLLWLRLVERLKNKDFLLEIKMAELNQNKISKQPDQPEIPCETSFILEINESSI